MSFMYCEECFKPIAENKEGNKKYCQGHSIFDLSKKENHEAIKKLQQKH